MALVEVGDAESRSGRELEGLLEEGNILLFPRSPFAPSEDDRRFLTAYRRKPSRFHKNIAYRPGSGRVTGLSETPPAVAERIGRILAEYSRGAREVAARLLPNYARDWRIDYASFRPEEEEGRELPVTSRNDLMHVDAFPSRPTSGDRILRMFTNIHPTKAREWISGGSFESLAERYAIRSGLLDRRRGAGRRALSRGLRAVGLRKLGRSPYDGFMLRFHDFLKENEDFQVRSPRERFSFPPGSGWFVLTDMVSHAVLSGQFALEQTVIVSRGVLAAPQRAPIAILERLAGRPMA